jgi:hypothetical protein
MSGTASGMPANPLLRGGCASSWPHDRGSGHRSVGLPKHHSGAPSPKLPIGVIQATHRRRYGTGATTRNGNSSGHQRKRGWDQAGAQTERQPVGHSNPESCKTRLRFGCRATSPMVNPEDLSGRRSNSIVLYTDKPNQGGERTAIVLQTECFVCQQ